ncbi:hypothetical protein GCM10022243_56330 [Saccharothrix violaceirubra]|uniref:Glycoside hydrolase family 42 N-terminal domain-containing protein n=1 Tax=Saccharothrix violaceirubra TaxID=413306 RepID=A0A7W7WX91_9PSEU|nr:hypothetical protein [Saccharothrix violaceirubra]MBB4967145.1 hypothetical protein [Saccharothrix violaceirubra]
MHRRFPALALVAALAACAPAPPDDTASIPLPGGPGAEYYQRWPHGPNPTGDPFVFPVTVWMQDPVSLDTGTPDGRAYRDIGVPATLGLWDDERWHERQAGLYATGWKAYVSAGKVDAVLADPGRAAHYLGYLVADEPDMQKSAGHRYHPELQPSAVLRRADEVRAQDPTRPTFVNFGMWMGTPDGRHDYAYVEETYEQDMRTYCQAADIASADFYGWTHPDPDKVGAFRYGQVVDTMRKWCGTGKPVYGFVETGHPYEGGGLITADQVESAVWNAIVHGADGINYFAHSFYPEGDDDFVSALTRPEIAARLKDVNARLQRLAPVLNAGGGAAFTMRGDGDVPITVRLEKGHVLAQADGTPARPDSGRTRAAIPVPVTEGTAEVVDENRTVPITGGRIVDDFAPYGFHVYRY